MRAEIGVFVCSFAGGKEGSLDIKELAAFARGLPGVAWVKVISELCRDAARSEMVSTLREKDVDRFVVAACSPMVQERRLMSIAAEAGLNPFMFTMANVREQGALVHHGREAQRKAETLLSMAVAKCSLLAPAPFDRRVPETRMVVVLGDGLRAALCADALNVQGMETVIVSPSVPLRLPILMYDSLATRLKKGRKVKTLRGEVVEADGAPGAFELLVEGDGPSAIRCGAMVVAFDPQDAGEGMGAKGLEEALDSGKIPGSIAIIADSWEPSFAPPELDLALNAAFRLKAAREDCRILIVTRDIRARGATEELHRKAQAAGVHFIRSEDEPRLGKGSSPELTVTDQVLGPLSIKSELIVDLRSGRNEASARACAMLGIATRPDGTPKEAKCRLVPGESLKAGLFVLDAWTEWCADDVLLDAGAVAGRASSLLRFEIEEGGAVAQVEEGKCSACLTCVRICPYGAPRMNDDMKAEIKFELCQGCGMCVTVCPSKAIDMHVYSDGQLAAEARAALGGKG